MLTNGAMQKSGMGHVRWTVCSAANVCRNIDVFIFNYDASWHCHGSAVVNGACPARLDSDGGMGVCCGWRQIVI